MEGPAGAVDVERGASRVVYWLLMILVSVAFFQTLGLTLITEPLNNLLNQVFAFLPQILSAAILLLIAWVLANIVRVLVRHLLNATRFEERLGPPEGEERRAPLSQTIGDVAYWLVFLFFLPAVVGALALEGLLGPVQGMLEQRAYLPAQHPCSGADSDVGLVPREDSSQGRYEPAGQRRCRSAQRTRGTRGRTRGAAPIGPDWLDPLRAGADTRIDRSSQRIAARVDH